MGKLQQQLGHLNDNDVLRELISASEKALANLDAQSAHDLFVNTEDAHHLMARLVTAKSDVRAEETRLQTIEERIVKNAKKIVGLLGGTSGYQTLRQQLAATSTDARWNLDDTLAQAQRALLQRLGIALAIFAVILGAAYLARGILFPPNPAGDAISAAQQALTNNGSIPDAISAINTGLTKVPTDTQLLLWQGVLQEKQSAGSGQAAFDKVRGQVSERDFFLERAQVFYLLAEPQRSLDDINALLAKQPDLPEAYYVRAGAQESLGHRDLAIEDLNRCADLAQAQGNDTLVATARVRLGMLMQSQ